MDCSSFESWLSSYIDRELGATKTIILEEHLRKCSECEKKRESLSNTKRTISALAAPLPKAESWRPMQKQIWKKIHQQRSPSIHRRYILYIAASLLLAISIFWLAYSPTATLPIPPLEARSKNRIEHTPIPVTAQMPPYEISAKIEGISTSNLTDAEKEFLYREGFVVSKRTFSSFVDLYRENQQRKIPSFITVEAATMGLSHILSRLQRDLEREVLFYRLLDFTDVMSGQSLELHRAIPKKYQQASMRNLAFFRVASVLLDSKLVWPEEILAQIQPQVAAELALIADAQQPHEKIVLHNSPIFGYPIDYSKFKVETKDEKIRRGFQCREWFARCVFLAPNKSETRSALLILMASLRGSQEGLEIWKEMHQLLTALYGEQDAPHLLDYLYEARQIYGNSISLDVFGNESLLHDFGRRVSRVNLPRIHSEVGYQRGLRLLGRRDIGCDYIFQQLAYPYVGTRSDPRIYPSVLDVGVILNAHNANVLAKKRGDTSFKGYTKKVQKYRRTLEEEFAHNSYPWEKGGFVSNAWMYQALMHPVGKGFPRFMHSVGWESRRMTTLISGSSGMLEVAEDSQVIFTGKNDFSFRGAIDPYPEFFNRMVTKIRFLEELLQKSGYPLQRPPGQEIKRYRKILKGLVQSANKTLSNEPLSEEERHNLWSFALGWKGEYNAATVKELSTIIYRNQEQFDGHWYTGIGPVRELWVAIPIDGEIRLARGGTVLLYEFHTRVKLSQKMWRDTPRKPGLVPWVKDYYK